MLDSLKQSAMRGQLNVLQQPDVKVKVNRTMSKVVNWVQEIGMVAHLLHISSCSYTWLSLCSWPLRPLACDGEVSEGEIIGIYPEGSLKRNNMLPALDHNREDTASLSYSVSASVHNTTRPDQSSSVTVSGVCSGRLNSLR